GESQPRRTGDPGVAVPAVAMAAPPPPIGAQGPDRPAVVPPPAALAPIPPPPALAPVPPPSNAALLAAPVAALVTAAEVAAADNALPHATPVRGSSGDAPDRIGLAPGVASSVAPRGIRVGPTGAAGPMPSGEVMPKGNPGEMLGTCACAAPPPKSTPVNAVRCAVTRTRPVALRSLLSSPRSANAPPASPCKSSARICASSSARQVNAIRYPVSTSLDTSGCRLMKLTIGRNKRLTNTTNPVASAA